MPLARHLNHPANGRANGVAVVIGGSLSGLAAARALADQFERVTVLERDTLNAGIGHRKGVPQDRHAHLLLPRGLAALEKLYPGLSEHLLAAGAAVFDVPDAGAWLRLDGYRPQTRAPEQLPGAARLPGGERLLGMTRPFLEYHLRQQLLAVDGVELLDCCQVTGLTYCADPTGAPGGRVTGVRLRWRVPGGDTDELPADLVVDASGRASQAARWLEALGYGRPPEEEIRVDVGYASRLYRPYPGNRRYLQPVFLLPQAKVEPGPPARRSGLALPVEGERWIVAVSGRGADCPPVDEESFLAYADGLGSPALSALVGAAEPASDIAAHRFPSSLRRRYERMSATPQGFIVLGDAACCINPIYGQGITASALQALALKEVLDSAESDSAESDSVESHSAESHSVETQGAGLVDLPRLFFRRAASYLDMPWRLACDDS